MLKGLHKAFVYGTLKRGLANHWLLTSGNHGRARFLGEAKLTEKYPLVVGGKFGVPFLLAARGKGKVMNVWCSLACVAGCFEYIYI